MDSSVGSELKQEQRFTLKDIKGNAVSLDQTLAQHQAVLLNFWATWCGYCVEEMPNLIRLQDQYKDKGFTILAVDVGEGQGAASAFSDKMKLNFPVVLDEETAVAQQYGVVGIPTSILIDAKGRILGQFSTYTPRLAEAVKRALEVPTS